MILNWSKVGLYLSMTSVAKFRVFSKTSPPESVIAQEPQLSRSVLEREKRKYNVNISLEAIATSFKPAHYHCRYNFLTIHFVNFC